MSTDVQAPPSVEIGQDKQSRRRSKDSEKVHRRSSNFQNKKYKNEHKFRKRSQSFNASGKFPPFKIRKKDFIIPPTKFLLGGNITDPLNLNSLQDEEVNRAMNAVTPKSSPLPTPRHRKGEIEVIIPPDITDPLNLNTAEDDATYEAMLTSPVKRIQKKKQKNKKRKLHRTSSGPGSGKEDSIEGAKLDETDPSPEKDKKSANPEEINKEESSDTTEPVTHKDTFQEPPKKRQKSEGNSNRASLRKLELKDRKAEMDKIVSPVIPQPGAWGERHRFKPPPQRETQTNVDQAVPLFKESNARFQYGNYNRYYGYRNPNHASDVRLKVLEKHKDLFRGKDVLDIGCNTGHLTLVIARDFRPNKVVGIDIDRTLINIARTNIKHYVNCGKKDKFFPVSMPIIFGPINVPGVTEDHAFPHNISFIQANYVPDSDALLQMEQPQFDVILCLSITKWIQLNWGDAGLKRAFKRMFAQLRPGGVLILEAQSWQSYGSKKKLTPEIWKNYHSITLFPHQFNQYLLSEVGFSKSEVIGCPAHGSRGFQRPIKLYFKEDPSFDTPVYSASTSVRESATPKYCRFTPGRKQYFANHLDRFGSERYRYQIPDSLHLQDEFSSGDGSSLHLAPFETPSSLNSPESGYSEGLFPRRYPPRPWIATDEPGVEAEGSSLNQEGSNKTSSHSEESVATSAVKDELSEEDINMLSADSNSQEGISQERREEEGECSVVETAETKQKDHNKAETDDRQTNNENVPISVTYEFCKEEKFKAENRSGLKNSEFVCDESGKCGQDVFMELNRCNSEFAVLKSEICEPANKPTVVKLEVCDPEETSAVVKLEVCDSEVKSAVLEMEVCDPEEKSAVKFEVCDPEETPSVVTSEICESEETPSVVTSELCESEEKLADLEMEACDPEEKSAVKFEVCDPKETSAVVKLEICESEEKSAVLEMEACDPEEASAVVKLEVCDSEVKSAVLEMEACDPEEASAVVKLEVCDSEVKSAVLEMEACDPEETSSVVKLEVCDPEETPSVVKSETCESAVLEIEACDPEEKLAVVKSEVCDPEETSSVVKLEVCESEEKSAVL